MSDENDSITDRTWARASDPISKVGYMDGAVDGQSLAFQSSFDKGYQLGFNFGWELGLKDSTPRVQNQLESTSTLADTRKINCQACLRSELVNEGLSILSQIQKETNDEYLKH